MASDVAAPAILCHPQSVSLPPDLARVADSWPALPPHIREAILTLCDAGLRSSVAISPVASCPHAAPASPTRSDLEEVAHRTAKECRHIVQACIREEEWQDADQEFFEVIADGIAELTSSIEVEGWDAD
ncbi:MAG TPA: hypothetical protein VGG64_17785 [Pirellulales bacterium]